MNKYKENLRKMIKENTWSKKLKNRNEDPASLNDLIWIYKSNNKIKSNLVFADDTKATTKRIRMSNFNYKWELELENRKVLALYINHTLDNGLCCLIR